MNTDENFTSQPVGTIFILTRTTTYTAVSGATVTPAPVRIDTVFDTVEAAEAWRDQWEANYTRGAEVEITATERTWEVTAYAPIPF